jgi:hypothetical protein
LDKKHILFPFTLLDDRYLSADEHCRQPLDILGLWELPSWCKAKSGYKKDGA